LSSHQANDANLAALRRPHDPPPQNGVSHDRPQCSDRPAIYLPTLRATNLGESAVIFRSRRRRRDRNVASGGTPTVDFRRIGQDHFIMPDRDIDGRGLSGRDRRGRPQVPQVGHCPQVRRKLQALGGGATARPIGFSTARACTLVSSSSFSVNAPPLFVQAAKGKAQIRMSPNASLSIGWPISSDPDDSSVACAANSVAGKKQCQCRPTPSAIARTRARGPWKVHL